MKKHLFPFQGGVEFLGVHFYLKVEGEGGLGFIFCFFFFGLLLHFVKNLLFFLSFEGGRRHGSFTLFFCSFLKGERGHEFFSFFSTLELGKWWV
jgi:hypothetical protein